MFIILIFCSFIQLSQAELKSVIKVNDPQFNSSVKPLLNSISSDFFEIYDQLNPELTEVKNLNHYFKKINIELNHIKKVCPKEPSYFCKASFEVINENIKKIDYDLKSLGDKKHCNPSNLASCGIIKNIIENEILTINKSKLLLNLMTGHSKNDKFFYDFQKSFDLSYAFHQSFIFQTLPKTNGSFYQNFLTSFIAPVENILIPSGSGALFTQWLDRLNFSINELNVIVDQKQKQLPNKIVSDVSKMHDKWNGWLRSLLQ